MNPASLAASRTAPVTGVVAATGFLAAYLAVSPVSGALADRPLPLPDAPPAETIAYYVANPLAVGSTAVLQVVSIACFAVFVAGLAPALRAAGAAWLPPVGHVSAAAMVISSAMSGVLLAIASSTSDATADVLRQASFYAGGVANVAVLGVFVLGTALALGRERLFGGGTRWFGLIAGTLAALSVISLAFYYASVLLPVGRLLCMIWTIVAAVVILRRVRAETR